MKNKLVRTIPAVALALTLALFAAACSNDSPTAATDQIDVDTTDTDDSSPPDIGASDTDPPAEELAAQGNAAGEPADANSDSGSGESSSGSSNDGTTAPTPTCDAPPGTDVYVDVAVDDPDGGLNLRAGPGVANEILFTFDRGATIVTTGECTVVGSTDWWQVTNPKHIGWVSSRFLSEHPIDPADPIDPGVGIGRTVKDLDNVGTVGLTLDEIAAKLADSYGFDEDVRIELVGDVELENDAGTATYDLTGFKDDSVLGYRAMISFSTGTTESGESIGYRAEEISQSVLCGRGVTADGLCI